tara:strand:+ start:1841 stop:2668 length:828 start_codon:yes stop_codon:yes gene_type:complete
MKTVFTNSEIVHEFNLQEQSYGRTSNSSMYFEYKKIYSYGSHYLLGEFIDDNTIMINDTGYSNTTSKHISLLRNATRDKRQFFITETKRDLVLNELKDLLNKLTRTRLKADYYKSTIDRLFKSYFEYIDFTKTRTKAKKSKEHREILKLYTEFYSNSDDLLQVIKEQQKKEKEKNQKEVQKKLKKWRSFEINWFSNPTSKDFLRVDKANNIIETSQGVKIPVEEGKRLLKLIDLKKIVGERVDNKYIVKALNGVLKVGCHNITMKEINNIKKQLT